MHQRTDADLVMLATMGNQDASNELLRRYQAQAKRIALKIVRQEELANEIVQEAFLAAYLSLDQLRDPARFGCWLNSIVRNFALSVLKEQRSRPMSLDQILEEQSPSEPKGFSQQSADPQQLAEERALQHLLLATIATLSKKERSAVLLYYYQQHSVQEIAMLLEISETAVKSRLFKARRTLRQQLSAEYETVSTQVVSTKGKHVMTEEQQASKENMSFLPKLSQAAIRILMLAYTESRQLNQPFIGTEHLLLALLHTEIEDTAELFLQIGLHLEQMRQAVRVVSLPMLGETARGMSQSGREVLTGGLKLAQYFQHQEQQPTHLLISILLQENTVAHQALQQLGIQLAQLRDQALQHSLGAEQIREIDLTKLQQVITQEESLVREAGPVDIRRESGINLDVDKVMHGLKETQQKLLKKYQEGDPSYNRIKHVFEHSLHRLKLTKRSGSTNSRVSVSISYTDVLMHANTIRLHFDHSHLGPEHLLYGILQLTTSNHHITQVLDHLQVESIGLQKALEQFLRESSYDVSDRTFKGGFTTAADEVITYAYEEAYHLEHNLIGAEHLLIGLVLRKGDFSAELLQKAGLSAGKIRSELELLPDSML